MKITATSANEQSDLTGLIPSIPPKKTRSPKTTQYPQFAFAEAFKSIRPSHDQDANELLLVKKNTQAKRNGKPLVYYDVSADGACYFRAYLAAKLKQSHWLTKDETSFADIKAQLERNGDDKKIVAAFSKAVQAVTKILPNSEELQARTGEPIDTEIIKAIFDRLKLSDFPTHLYQMLITEQGCYLWRPELVSHCLMSYADVDLTQMDGFASFIEYFTNELFAFMSEQLGAPLDTNADVHLAYNGQDHYDLVAPTGFFTDLKTTQVKENLFKTIALAVEQAAIKKAATEPHHKECLTQLQQNDKAFKGLLTQRIPKNATEEKFRCEFSNRAMQFAALKNERIEIAQEFQRKSKKPKPLVSFGQAVQAAAQLLTNGLMSNAVHYADKYNLNLHPKTNPTSWTLGEYLFDSTAALFGPKKSKDQTKAQHQEANTILEYQDDEVTIEIEEELGSQNYYFPDQEQMFLSKKGQKQQTETETETEIFYDAVESFEVTAKAAKAIALKAQFDENEVTVEDEQNDETTDLFYDPLRFPTADAAPIPSPTMAITPEEYQAQEERHHDKKARIRRELGHRAKRRVDPFVTPNPFDIFNLKTTMFEPSAGGNEFQSVVTNLAGKQSNSAADQKTIADLITDVTKQHGFAGTMLFDSLDAIQITLLEHSADFRNAFSYYWQRTEENLLLYSKGYSDVQLENFIAGVDLQKSVLNGGNPFDKAVQLFGKMLIDNQNTLTPDYRKLGLAFAALNIDLMQVRINQNEQNHQLFKQSWSAQLQKSQTLQQQLTHQLKTSGYAEHFARVNPFNQGVVFARNSALGTSTLGLCNAVSTAALLQMKDKDIHSYAAVQQLFDQIKTSFTSDPVASQRVIDSINNLNFDLQETILTEGKHQGQSVLDLMYQNRHPDFEDFVKKLMSSDDGAHVSIRSAKAGEHASHSISVANLDISTDSGIETVKVLIDTNTGVIPCFNEGQLRAALTQTAATLPGFDPQKPNDFGSFEFFTHMMDSDDIETFSKLKSPLGGGYSDLFTKPLTDFQDQHPITTNKAWQAFFPEITVSKRSTALKSDIAAYHNAQSISYDDLVYRLSASKGETVKGDFTQELDAYLDRSIASAKEQASDGGYGHVGIKNQGQGGDGGYGHVGIKNQGQGDDGGYGHVGIKNQGQGGDGGYGHVGIKNQGQGDDGGYGHVGIKNQGQGGDGGYGHVGIKNQGKDGDYGHVGAKNPAQGENGYGHVGGKNPAADDTAVASTSIALPDPDNILGSLGLKGSLATEQAEPIYEDVTFKVKQDNGFERDAAENLASKVNQAREKILDLNAAQHTKDGELTTEPVREVKIPTSTEDLAKDRQKITLEMTDSAKALPAEDLGKALFSALKNKKNPVARVQISTDETGAVHSKVTASITPAPVDPLAKFGIDQNKIAEFIKAKHSKTPDMNKLFTPELMDKVKTGELELVPRALLQEVEIENKKIVSLKQQLNEELTQYFRSKNLNPEEVTLTRPLSLEDSTIQIRVNGADQILEMPETGNLRARLGNFIESFNKRVREFVDAENLKQGKIKINPKVNAIASVSGRALKGVGSLMSIYGLTNLMAGLQDIGEDTTVAKIGFALNVVDLGVDQIANIVGAVNYITKHFSTPVQGLSTLSQVTSKASMGISLLVNIGEIILYSYALHNAESRLEKRLAELQLGMAITNLTLMVGSIGASSAFPPAAPIFMTAGLVLAGIQNYVQGKIVAEEMSNSAFEAFEQELTELKTLLDNPELLFDEETESITVISTKIAYLKLRITKDRVTMFRHGKPVGSKHLKSIPHYWDDNYSSKWYPLRLFSEPSRPEQGGNGQNIPNFNQDYGFLLSAASRNFMHGYDGRYDTNLPPKDWTQIESDNLKHRVSKSTHLKSKPKDPTWYSGSVFLLKEQTTATMAQCLADDFKGKQRYVHEFNKDDNKPRHIVVKGHPVRVNYRTTQCYKLSYNGYNYDPQIHDNINKLNACQESTPSNRWKSSDWQWVVRRFDNDAENKIQKHELYQGKVFLTWQNNRYWDTTSTFHNGNINFSYEKRKCYRVPERVDLNIVSPDYELSSGGSKTLIYHFPPDNLVNYLKTNTDLNYYQAFNQTFQIEKHNAKDPVLNYYKLKLIPDGDHHLVLYPATELRLTDLNEGPKIGRVQFFYQGLGLDKTYEEELTQQGKVTSENLFELQKWVEQRDTQSYSKGTIFHLTKNTADKTTVRMDKSMTRPVGLHVNWSVKPNDASKPSHTVNSTIIIEPNGEKLPSVKLSHVSHLPIVKASDQLHLCKQAVDKNKDTFGISTDSPIIFTDLNFDSSDYHQQQHDPFTGKGWYFSENLKDEKVLKATKKQANEAMFVPLIWRMKYSEEGLTCPYTDALKDARLIATEWVKHEDLPDALKAQADGDLPLRYFYSEPHKLLFKQYGNTEVKWWMLGQATTCNYPFMPNIVKFNIGKGASGYMCNFMTGYRAPLDNPVSTGQKLITADFRDAVQAYRMSGANGRLSFDDFVAQASQDFLNRLAPNEKTPFVVKLDKKNQGVMAGSDPLDVRFVVSEKTGRKIGIATNQEQIVSINHEKGFFVTEKKSAEDQVEINKRKLFLKSDISDSSLVERTIKRLLSDSKLPSPLSEKVKSIVFIPYDNVYIVRDGWDNVYQLDENFNRQHILEVNGNYLNHADVNLQDKAKILEAYNELIEAYGTPLTEFLRLQVGFNEKGLKEHPSVLFEKDTNQILYVPTVYLNAAQSKNPVSNDINILGKKSYENHKNHYIVNDINHKNLLKLSRPYAYDSTLQLMTPYNMMEIKRQELYLDVRTINEADTYYFELPTIKSLILLPASLTDGNKKSALLTISPEMQQQLDLITLAHDKDMPAAVQRISLRVESLPTTETSATASPLVVDTQAITDKIKVSVIEIIEGVKMLIVTVPTTVRVDGKLFVGDPLVIRLQNPFDEQGNVSADFNEAIQINGEGLTAKFLTDLAKKNKPISLAPKV